MPAARRCSAGSPAAISGAAASRIALPRPASFATPTLSGPTERWGGATPRLTNSPIPSPANGPDEHGHRYVVLTGGEPLLQVDAEFIEALHARGFEIGIETNGTIEPPDGLDWICVSPKAGAELVVRQGHELKLIYPQAGAMPEAFADLAFERFSLQPMDGPDMIDQYARAVDYCMRHPQWRLSLQTHKTLGIR